MASFCMRCGAVVADGQICACQVSTQPFQPVQPIYNKQQMPSQQPLYGQPQGIGQGQMQNQPPVYGQQQAFGQPQVFLQQQVPNRLQGFGQPQVQNQQQGLGQQPLYGQQQEEPHGSDSGKAFSILAYIPYLCLFGIYAKSVREDEKVRFHVGQGLIFTLLFLPLLYATSLLQSLFALILCPRDWASLVYSYTSGGIVTYVILSWLLWLAFAGAVLSLMIIGIVNVSGDKEKPLPIIGKLAFYK